MGLRVLPPRRVDLAGGDNQRVADVSPNRLYLIMFHGIGANPSGLKPSPSFTGNGIRPFQGQEHVLIHDSTYPGLTQGEWYMSAAIAADVYIVEALSLPDEEE